MPVKSSMRTTALVIWVTLLTLLVGPAFSRDGYQDRPSVCGGITSGPRLERCHDWISTVRRPDYRGSSCCGDGDAYIADDFELDKDGNLYAILSLDYPDIAPGYSEDPDGTPRDGVPILGMKRGTRILVPPEKRNALPEDANRSSHGVIFLFPGTETVICYFFPPLV